MSFPIGSSNADVLTPRTGITTVGYGLATAPAVSASLQIMIVNADRFHGPPAPPRVEAVPGVRARNAVAPIVEAIRSHESVESVEVVVPLPLQSWGPQSAVARIDVAVRQPERGDLELLLNDAAIAASEPDLVIGYVGARFDGSKVAELDREARRLAIEDARRQADVQAELIDVVLGDVVSLMDAPTGYQLQHGMYGPMLIPPDSTSPPLPPNFLKGMGSVVVLPPFDPNVSPIQVDAFRRVVMTFAIAG